MSRRGSGQSFGAVWGGLRADYAAAQVSRFRKRLTGVSALGSGADFHYRSDADYLRMMELARDLDRNNMVVQQAMERLVTLEMGAGLQWDPQCGVPVEDEGVESVDDAVKDDNRYLSEKFGRWAEDMDRCDVQGRFDLHGLAKHALRSRHVDGDIFALLLDEGSVQFMEGHRCRTPRNTKKNVVHGVLLDERRRALEYWFTKEDVNASRPVVKVNETAPYPVRADDGLRVVLHVVDPKRTSQTRGVTLFAPIADPLGMHDDIQFATLVQKQIVSCIAFFRKRSAGGTYGVSKALGAQEDAPLRDGGSTILEGLAPGLIIDGQPGEELVGFSPQVPNETYRDHVLLVLAIVAVNLKMPLIMLLLDASETNFSGWRGAMDMAREVWRSDQRMMLRQFYRPIYEWKLRQFASEDPRCGAMLARWGWAEYVRCDWHLPAWPYIEPEKDAKGDALILRERLNSPRRVLGRRGLDASKVHRELVVDNGRLIEMAIMESQRIASRTGVTVDWREVLAVPTGVKGQMAVREESDEENVSRAASQS